MILWVVVTHFTSMWQMDRRTNMTNVGIYLNVCTARRSNASLKQCLTLIAKRMVVWAETNNRVYKKSAESIHRERWREFALENFLRVPIVVAVTVAVLEDYSNSLESTQLGQTYNSRSRRRVLERHLFVGCTAHSGQKTATSFTFYRI